MNRIVRVMSDEAKRDTDDVVLTQFQPEYGFGWVCAPTHMSRAQVEEAVNAKGWAGACECCHRYILRRVHEDNTLVSPGPCGDTPDGSISTTRRHWTIASEDILEKIRIVWGDELIEDEGEA
jgi:hypothetical protein